MDSFVRSIVSLLLAQACVTKQQAHITFDRIDMTVDIKNMYVPFGLNINDEKALKINKKK